MRSIESGGGFLALMPIVLLSLTAANLRGQDLPIPEWAIAGPFPVDTGRAGVLADHLPEGEMAVLPDGGDFFRTVAADSNGGVDLNGVFGTATDWHAAYAHSYVYSPDERTVALVMDSDDDIVGIVNGQRVWVNFVPRGLGRGADTAMVRLARGWNSVLLKVINRTGGFGVLGRIAPAGGVGLDGLRATAVRPAEVTAHNYPSPSVLSGEPVVEGRMWWVGDRLVATVALPLTAWGREPLRNVTGYILEGVDTLATASHELLPPGMPYPVSIDVDFATLRAAALGQAEIRSVARWDGGSLEAAVWIDPALLLRLAGGRLALDWGDAVQDEAAGPMRTSVQVPSTFSGLSLDLIVPFMGAGARYQVNGSPVQWEEGRITLCDDCVTGTAYAIAIEPDIAVIEQLPHVIVRQIGYPEYADAHMYARVLSRMEAEPPEPDPLEWLEALGNPDASVYPALLQHFEEAYRPFEREARSDTLLLLGNSHIDAAWLWRWEETREVVENTWRTSLKLGRLFPGYTFTASAAAYYAMLDNDVPGLADSIRTAYRNGTWDFVGGWWVEPDQNNPGGESLVRQGLYGQRYFENAFGRRTTVAWTPDTFGYPWTLPQILRLSGFDSFVTQKIRWNDSTEFDLNAFEWQGLDGTRIFSYNPYSYVHNLEGRRLADERIEDRRRTGGNNQIVLYGVGDHGGGPTIEMLQRAERLRRIPTFPVMRYSNAADAIASVVADVGDDLAVWNDELYLEYHRGVQTTWAIMKERNRRSEAMLQTAEALAVAAGGDYPRQALESAWRQVLFNQFHDILPGSSIRGVYYDAHIFYDSAWTTLDSITGSAFAGLRSRMDTRSNRNVVVFNPLGWERSDYVTVDTGDGPYEFFVEDVPAFGAVAVRLPDGDDRWRDGEAEIGPNWISNSFLRVEFDTTTGDIVSILDLSENRQVLAAGGRANVLRLFDDLPNQWDAWNIDITGDWWDVNDVSSMTFGTDDRGAFVDLVRTWGASYFRQRIGLDRGSRHIEVENDFEWHERRKLLKAVFELGVTADSATYEIPYGTIGRSGVPRTARERAKHEVPGQRWADVSQTDYGVSIFNDSKYGWDYRDNVLRLSLLRAPMYPDSLADRGAHTFRYAIYPHVGGWRAAGTLNMATEYNTPMLAGVEPEHRGDLGREASFARSDSPNVRVEWLKRAEDSDRLVVRLVEWHGSETEATIEFSCRVRTAHTANLLEDELEELDHGRRSVRVQMRPYQIETLLIGCDQ